MEQTLVTVLMTVFNGELYLREAIDSILNQTYKNLELLIINDGSNDRSIEIINSYKDQRIRLINFEKNQGLITVLNIGINEAKGCYIARMDADDVAYPERIEKQVVFFKKNPKITICSTLINNNKRFKTYINSPLNSNEIKARLLFDNIICHPTVMFKSNLLIRKSNYYKNDFPHAEDYALWLESINSENFHIIPETLLMYREHDYQISRTKRLIQIDSVAKAHQSIFNMLDISPTSEELSLHSKIFFIEYSYNPDFFLSVENWLLKLKQQNRKKNIFETTDFENIISWTWFEICTDFASKSFKTYKYFFKSNLYRPNTISWYYLFKFTMKNIIAKRKL